MTQIKYRPDIDALRAIAVLSVVFYHFFPTVFKAGFIGVDLFFVISGFLITTLILNGIRNGGFSFLDFYQRRIKRILPALLFTVSLTLIGAYFTFSLDQWMALGKQSLFSMIFLSNELLYQEVGYFDTFAEYKIFLHFWSLAIEEQFYLLWPLLLYLGYRKWGKWIIFLCFSLSLAYHIYLLFYDTSAAFYRGPSRFWELIAGAILAYSQHQSLENTSAKKANIQSILGFISLLLCFLLIRFEYHFPGYCAFLVVLSAYLIIGAGEKAVFNQWLGKQKWLVWIGLLSYPLYLWHWVLLTGSKLVFLEELSMTLRFNLIALSIFMAWISHQWVEKKLRFRQNTWVSVLLILWSIGLAILGGLIWKIKLYPLRMEKEKAVVEMIYGENQFKSQYSLSSCDVLHVPVQIKGYCKGFQLKDLQSFQQKGILLWGDSHAGAWSPVFFEYAKSQGIPVVLISHGAFPPIFQVRRSENTGKAERYNQLGWNEPLFDWIQVLQPQTLLMFSRWTLFLQPWYVHGIHQKTPYLTHDPKAEADDQSTHLVFQQQLPQTLQRLTASQALAHTQIIVFKTVPILKYFIALGIAKALDFIPTQEEHLSFQAKANEYIDIAIASTKQKEEKIKSFDPTPYLCPVPEQKCHIQFGNDYLYTDNNHLSARGALAFEKAILRLLKD